MPDYATTAELKAFVRIGDAADDAQIALALSAASRSVDRACNRQFGLSAVQDRFYTADGNGWVEIDDLPSIIGLVVGADSAGDNLYGTSVTGWVGYPLNAPSDGLPYTTLGGQYATPGGLSGSRIKVTAAFGWAAVPTTIKQATLLQASRFLSRRDSPYGIAGSPDAGSEMRLLAKMDPDVSLIVRPFYRWWGMV